MVAAMKKWFRRFLLVLAAPVVWIAGCLLLCMAPRGHEVECTPVAGLPSRPLTMREVAELNRMLDERCSDMYRLWYITWSVRMCGSEYYLAIPTADGGLELVHARPALVWADAGPVESAEAVVQEWLAKLNRKGKVTP
jgi:hypothetical protein